MVDESEKAMVHAYENRSITYKFDEQVANDICHDIYLAQLDLLRHARKS